MLNNFKKNYCCSKFIAIVEDKKEELKEGTILKYKNKYYKIKNLIKKTKNNKNIYLIKKTKDPELYFDLLDIKNAKKKYYYCKSLFFMV